MRLSIRDVLWLTVVVALAVGWWVERAREARLAGRAAQLLNLGTTEGRPAGPSDGQKCKWTIYLQHWSAKGLADLL
jgi:hypothetical protein